MKIFAPPSHFFYSSSVGVHSHTSPKNINLPGSPFTHATDDQQRIPPNCDDGGLKVTLSLSKDKVNPLDYVPEDITATFTLHNTNPYPITFGWVNTPLDHPAGSTGIFRVYSSPCNKKCISFIKYMVLIFK